jgi:UDP-N-acetylmuramyl tripeptide synthase
MASYTLNDSRRLTGANLYWDRPSAIVDVHVVDFDLAQDADAQTLIGPWSAAATGLLDAVGHGGERLNRRVFDGGMSLLISAPIDALYSMCELNEVALKQALADLGEGPPVDFEAEGQRLRGLFEDEACSPVLAMQSAAAERGVPFMWDEHEVSIGYGPSAVVWPWKEVPAPDTVDWGEVRSVPLGLVTGTNGKSTTVRMAASILRAAGLSAGLTSTDWIRVGDVILDTGDYSGPGGARTLMRHPETEIAVLEVARGGLLRRGLGVERAAAALITNIAADHLGEYGINTVSELAEAKFIVRKALKGTAPLILNADDALSVAQADKLEDDFTRNASERFVWFGLDPENPVIARHLAAGGRAVCFNQGWLEIRQAGNARRIVKTGDIPATLNGTARHNICNALGAVALCRVLGIEDEALRRGMQGFRGDEHDNPGRANWFDHGGVRILVDFAHNVHGMNALTAMVGAVEAERRVLLMGQAGDRSDSDIRALAFAACSMKPDRLIVCDMPGYERGREAGEVPGLIRSAAMDAGIDERAVSEYPAPPAAVEAALEASRPGDLLIIIALSQREQVLDLIHRFLGQ